MTSSTASQGASSSSSSYSSIHPCRYEVFLSFRGKDTRHNFTAHLHQALLQKGINTFIDDEELRSGEEISSALLKAIKESKISIVIFSEDYASSKWCLDELLKIVETKGQKVIPVFYKVDPSDVRYQKNNYEKALAKHAKRLNDDEKVEKWKAALTKVANLSGWHLEIYRNEAEFIYKIVQNVSAIVNDTYLFVAKYPVGIESRVHKINSFLSNEMNDTRMVGILGAGGIGKTAIAKDIYNLIASQFEGSCFLSNVRETSKQHSGMVQLQNTLLSKILGRQDVKVDSVDEGITVIKKRCCSKRVLLILDDVDDKSDQLDKLAGEVNWFGLGSRIIITTRDKKVVVDHLIYWVRELDRKESLELFCWNAFHGGKPTDDFLKLTEDAISYAGGLPLALEVLGSHLYKEDIHKWRSVLDKYKRIPQEKIQKRLEISYDGLDRDAKNIFLDIACFFKGKSEGYVKTILASSDCFPDVSIPVLIQKSLITIDNCGRLAMHDLLQDMGREVVQQESPYNPGERSRLWFHEDVRDVLENDTGTNKVQGILVDLPKGEDMVDLSSKAFENMRSLRLLMVNPNARFSTGPNFLPSKLILLDWPNYPLGSLPSNFRGRNLRILRIPGSSLKELKGIKNCQSMKIMNFRGCQFLETTPDVSSIPNLENFTFDKCTNLVEIHHSVGRHDKLVRLSVEGCYNLSNFPRSIQMRSLKNLNLKGCSSLSNFPEIGCEMKSLTVINFGETGIKELPPSIRYLTGLQILLLYHCKNLTNLPSSIYKLQHLEVLYLSHCSKLVKFPEKIEDGKQSMSPPTNSSVSNDDCSSKVFPALRELYLYNCVLLESADFFRIFNCYSTLEVADLSGSGILTIPACIKRFVALSVFEFNDCKQLREIQAFPPTRHRHVDARSCMSLQIDNKCWLPELPVAVPVGSGIELEASSISDDDDGNDDNWIQVTSIQEHRGEKRHFDIVVSGNKIPEWFSYRKEVSNSNSCEIDIDVPADLDGEISRIVFSAVIETKKYAMLTIFVISGGVEIYRSFKSFTSGHCNFCVWLRFYVPEPCKLKEFNGHLRVKFVHEELNAMKSCGVHLVHRCEEKTIDSIDGIQITKRPRDDDDDEKFESNCYPQQKRHSSTLGIRISDTEAEAKDDD